MSGTTSGAAWQDPTTHVRMPRSILGTVRTPDRLLPAEVEAETAKRTILIHATVLVCLRLIGGPGTMVRVAPSGASGIGARTTGDGEGTLMAWDEWEQLKADAATRSTQMQLNQHPAEPGGGAAGPNASADLKSDKRAWVKAGEGTKGLAEPIGPVLAKLEGAQTGLDSLTGCQSAAAQAELCTSWSKYVRAVRARSKSLGGLLESSGHDLAKTDESLKSELDAIKFRDTPAVGGQSKEK